MQLIPPLRYLLDKPWFVDNSSSKSCVETITNGTRNPLLVTNFVIIFLAISPWHSLQSASFKYRN